MNAHTPIVSVLLAVYNAELYIEAAIRSILEQSYKNFELILIDDGSVDSSPLICRKLAAEDARVRLLIRPNKGIPQTANEMISLARGRYLSLMDHDDIKLPRCVETQLAYLEAHPECVAVGTQSVQVDGLGRMIRRRRKLSFLTSPITKRFARFDVFPPQIPSITNPTALIRTDAMRRVGGYRPNMKYAHDFDLWFRLSCIGEIHQINEEHLHYRVHGKNTTVLYRAEIIRYEIISVLSGFCGVNGLDDSAIITSFSGGPTFDRAIADYKKLIGTRLPVETYILHKAIGSALPEVANAFSFGDLAERSIKHALSLPITAPKLHLLRRTVRRSLKQSVARLWSLGRASQSQRTYLSFE